MIRVTESLNKKEEDQVNILLEVMGNSVVKAMRFTATSNFDDRQSTINNLKYKAYKIINDAYITIKDASQKAYDLKEDDHGNLVYKFNFDKSVTSVLNSGEGINDPFICGIIGQEEKVYKLISQTLDNITSHFNDIIDLLD